MKTVTAMLLLPIALLMHHLTVFSVTALASFLRFSVIVILLGSVLVSFIAVFLWLLRFIEPFTFNYVFLSDAIHKFDSTISYCSECFSAMISFHSPTILVKHFASVHPMCRWSVRVS